MIKLAIALAAVMAVAAAAAATASALTYKSSVNPVMLMGWGGGNHKFTVDGQNVTCTKAEFYKEEQSVPTSQITSIVPRYSGCTAFGFTATVNMSSCTYTFEEPTQPNPNSQPHVFTAHVALVCPNNPVVIKTNVIGAQCTVTVDGSGGVNSTLAHVMITTNTPGGHVSVNATVNGISATKTEDGGFCPLSGTGTVNNASYNGSTTVEGTSGAALSIS